MQFSQMLESVARYVATAKMARGLDSDDALLLANRQLRAVVTERQVAELRRAA